MLLRVERILSINNSSAADSIRVELCSECHPFYTGRQKLVDSGGRVERYKQRMAKSQAKKAEADARTKGA